MIIKNYVINSFRTRSWFIMVALFFYKYYLPAIKNITRFSVVHAILLFKKLPYFSGSFLNRSLYKNPHSFICFTFRYLANKSIRVFGEGYFRHNLCKAILQW